MAYRIAFSRQIRRQIGGLPGHVKAMAKQEIAALSDDPRPRHSRERVEHSGHFRLWLGREHRLVRLVLDDEQRIEIEYVGFRTPRLYEQLGLARPPAE